MSAGRDIERLISDWLAEEAAPGSPDRLLTDARRSIATTGQRRMFAAWREPVYLNPMRLAAMAAALIIAVGGGTILGRLTSPTAPAAPGPTASATTPAATEAPTVTLATYRAARNEICQRYAAQLNPLKDQLGGLYDVATPAADRAASTLALANIVDGAVALIAELERLEVPPSMLADHTTNVARLEDSTSLIRAALARLASGDLAGAQALDLATDPLSRQVEAFETKYQLAACP